MGKKKFHYSFIVCFAGILLIFVVMGVVNNGFSIYMPYLKSLNGFSNTQTSLLVNIRSVVTFISMAFVTQYYKKFSIRTGTFVACLLVALGLVIDAFAGKNYFLYCLGSVIQGASYGVGAMVPMSVLMKTWFKKGSNTAVGVCTTGSGIASIVLPPLINSLIQRFSLKNAFLIEAMIVLAVTAVTFVLIRNKPEDMGLRPYGADEPEEQVSGKKLAPILKDRKLNPMTRSAWLCIWTASLVMGVLANPAFIHLSVLFTSEGCDITVTAYLMSMIGVLLTVSKILLGRLADTVGGKKACTIFGIILFAGLVLCCLTFTRSNAVVISATLLTGIGLSISTVSPSIWASDLSDSQEEYPGVLKRIQLLYALGALCFSSVPGIIADLCGGYIPAYGLFAILLCFSIFMMRRVYKKRQG